MTTIQEQIALTDEVLGKLEALSRDVYVAGGAPRDWSYNRVANDIDIWMCPTATRGSEAKFVDDVNSTLGPFFGGLKPARAYAALLGGVQDITPDVEQYQGVEFRDLNPNLSQVLEFYVRGQKFNLMRLRYPVRPESLVEMFPLSIAQAWYRRYDAEPSSTDWFKLGKRNNIIFEQLGVGYGRRGKWVKKVRGYYPDHKVMYR